MAVSNRIKHQHLLWRAAFGPMAENAASLDALSQKNLWALLVKTSSKPVVKLEVTKNPADEYMNGMTDPKEMEKVLKEEFGSDYVLKKDYLRTDPDNNMGSNI